MAAGRSTQYHFAIFGDASRDLTHLVSLARDLRGEYGDKGLLAVTLHGRPATNESILLFQFSFLSYSGALRSRMEREARKLSCKLLDPQLLPEDERDRFYEKKLKMFEVKGELLPEPAAGLAAFRKSMQAPAVRAPAASAKTSAPVSSSIASTVSGAPAPVSHEPVAPPQRRAPVAPTPAHPHVSVVFDSEDALADSLHTCVAQGVLGVPLTKEVEQGSTIEVELKSKGGSTVRLSAHVLGPDFDGKTLRIVPEPSSAGARDFLRQHGQAAREGRKLAPAPNDRRQSDRFHTLLEVSFHDFPELSTEFATNISQGGLFVRTQTPPPLRSQVRLSLTLPGGEKIATAAEVVHVVRPDDAERFGAIAGVGISFARNDEAFQGRIDALIKQYEQRRPLVLIVDDDAFFRRVLSDALTVQGMETVVVGNSDEAMNFLIDRLDELDAMTLDVAMPKLDGFGLIDRIRRLGGETDLRILVISSRVSTQVDDLVRQRHVTNAIQKSTPLPELVAAVRAVLRKG
ncbi:MAG: response regulator [Myxococcaceae bacterium]